MNFQDEKDYIMRIIKEMVRILFSLMFGKQCDCVEREAENGYEVSGRRLGELLKMIDDGKINEAENILLTGIDFGKKEEVAAAALFYQVLSERDEEYLRANDYSKEEVLEGMCHILQSSGYGDAVSMVEQL